MTLQSQQSFSVNSFQVRLYEVIETSTKLYLILELGDGGDMYDYIMKHDQGLDEEQAKEYFAQVCMHLFFGMKEPFTI